jgi:hypothetical protein
MGGPLPPHLALKAGKGLEYVHMAEKIHSLGHHPRFSFG